MENNTITIPELASALGVSTRAIEKQINIFKQNGFLKRIGAARGGHWQILKQ